MYIGITAEWNPFHEGHSYMIQKIKELYPEAPIAAVMSGAFTQRGEPAILDKWTRAKWAVYHGIDAVIEFPVLYALQSADIFAENAVFLLSELGCTHIAFGAESMSLSDLKNISSWSLTEEYKTCFHELLSKGVSYSSAITQSIEIKFPQIGQELRKPNNLLGFRYVRAAEKQNLSLSFIIVRRSSLHPASATKARESLLSGGTYPLLTDIVKKEAEQLIKSGHFLSYSRYEDACLLINKRLSEQQLTATGLFREGLEHRWFKNMKETSWNKALEQIKNKRYLYSRLKRIGAALLVSEQIPSPFMQKKKAAYARLLALRETESHILKQSRLPIISNTAGAYKKLSSDDLSILSLDLQSTDIQNFCMENQEYRKGREDFYKSPVII